MINWPVQKHPNFTYSSRCLVERTRVQESWVIFEINSLQTSFELVIETEEVRKGSKATSRWAAGTFTSIEDAKDYAEFCLASIKRNGGFLVGIPNLEFLFD